MKPLPHGMDCELNQLNGILLVEVMCVAPVSVHI